MNSIKRRRCEQGRAPDRERARTLGVLARAGRAVPRDSDQQEATLGTLVPGGVAAAEAGDLVFCPGHVGWVSGPDRLLHANAHHMAVAEEPLSAFVARIAARGLAFSSVRRL